MNDDFAMINNSDLPPQRHSSAVSTPVLAMIGAAGAAKDKVAGTVDRVAGDGPGIRMDARRVVRQVVSLPVEVARSTVRFTGRQLDRVLDATLGALNMPRRSDVDRLSQRVADLSRKMDVLEPNAEQ